MPLIQSGLRFGLFWLCSGLGLAVLILALSLGPPPDFSSIGDWSDKVLHVSAFAALMVWFGGVIPLRYHWLLGIILLAYGAGIEVAQSMVPTRAMEWGDFVADFVGILIGGGLNLAGLRHWCRWVERLVART